MTLLEMEEKYFRLVWWARRFPEDHPYWDATEEGIRKGVFISMMKVEKKYPEETHDLFNDDTNWHHGFNSGALAALRYVMTLTEEGEEAAMDEFPMLDT